MHLTINFCLDQQRRIKCTKEQPKPYCPSIYTVLRVHTQYLSQKRRWVSAGSTRTCFLCVAVLKEMECEANEGTHFRRVLHKEAKTFLKSPNSLYIRRTLDVGFKFFCTPFRFHEFFGNIKLRVRKYIVELFGYKIRT